MLENCEQVSSCAGPLREMPGTPAALHLRYNPRCFSQADIMGTPLLGTGVPGWGAGCGAKTPHSSRGTFTAELSLVILNRHILSVGPACSFLHDSYQSHGGFFLISLVIGHLFS